MLSNERQGDADGVVIATLENGDAGSLVDREFAIVPEIVVVVGEENPALAPRLLKDLLIANATSANVPDVSDVETMGVQELNHTLVNVLVDQQIVAIVRESLAGGVTETSEVIKHFVSRGWRKP